LSVNLLVFAHDAIGRPAPAVMWQSGRLTLKAECVPLDAVLKEISRQTGLRVISAVSLGQPVNADFSRLTLRSALERVLAGENYAIVEKSGENSAPASVAIMILGAAPRSHAAGSPNASRPAAGTGESSDRLKSLMDAIHSGGPQTERTLQQAADDSDPNVSALALQTLAERNPQAGRDAIRRVAETGNGPTRFAALQELRQLGDTDSLLPELAAALHDHDTDVKGYALQMLLQDGGPEAMQTVRQALSDPDPNFRAAVNAALANHSAQPCF
jgi:hypothetical protein